MYDMDNEPFGLDWDESIFRPTIGERINAFFGGLPPVTRAARRYRDRLEINGYKREHLNPAQRWLIDQVPCGPWCERTCGGICY